MDTANKCSEVREETEGMRCSKDKGRQRVWDAVKIKWREWRRCSETGWGRVNEVEWSRGSEVG